MSSTSFYLLKTFPIWIEEFGLPATLSIYGVACVLGAVYVIFMVPEMKGKRIDDSPNDAPQTN